MLLAAVLQTGIDSKETVLQEQYHRLLMVSGLVSHALRQDAYHVCVNTLRGTVCRQRSLTIGVIRGRLRRL